MFKQIDFQDAVDFDDQHGGWPNDLKEMVN